MTRERWFPMMGSASARSHADESRGGSIPWSAIAPFARNAERNHSQTLERLAERGGLSWCEAWAVMTGRRWNDPARPANCREAVLALVAEVELDIVDRLRGHVRNKAADSNVLRDMLAAADEIERMHLATVDCERRIAEAGHVRSDDEPDYCSCGWAAHCDACDDDGCEVCETDDWCRQRFEDHLLEVTT